MYVEIILEYDPECPRCTRLEPILRQLASELGVPFIPRFVGARSPAAAVEQQISKTFSPEWIQAYGSKEQKRLAEKYPDVLRAFSETYAVPVTIIRWFNGRAWNEIYIRGFVPDKKSNEQLIRNIARLIRGLTRR